MASLVIKNDGLGDLVLASGLISDLANAVGPLDLITCESNREVAENIPGLRRVIYVSRDGLRLAGLGLRFGLRIGRWGRSDSAVLKALSDEQYDDAFSLRRYIRQSTLILMRRVRAKRRHCAWMFPTNASHPLAEQLSRGWGRFRGDPGGSELDYYRRFLKAAIGLESRSSPGLRCCAGVTLVPQPDEVGLIIGGLSTNWPPGNWQALARDLRAQGKRLTLFGGPDAADLASTLLTAVPDATSKVGCLSLAAAVNLLCRMELVIGNDTGMTHFASLCTSRVLVILGGGTFGRFFPWPEASNQHVIHRKLPCYDCNWNCHLPERLCLTEVGVGEVLEYSRAVIRGDAPRLRNLAN